MAEPALAPLRTRPQLDTDIEEVVEPGEQVERTGDFGPALERALQYTREHSLPALIELRYDGNLITPNATLEAIRQNAQASRLAK